MDAEISVLSWNLWFGGTKMTDGRAKQIALMQDESPDILCLQECWGDGGIAIARGLGYEIAQHAFDTAVASRWPVTLLPTDTAPYATAARVDAPGGPLLVWSVHLEPEDYGPYRANELPDAAAEVFAQEGERIRDEQAAAVLTATDALLASLPTGTPVIIAGDFNVPSPADWDGRLRPDAAWPATTRLLEAGFTDTFRAVHPDPLTAPGLTWSQIHTLEDEPRDRIDFVFTRGFEVSDCWHLGQATDPEAAADAGLRDTGGQAAYIPDHAENAFASDHLAVRAQLFR